MEISLQELRTNKKKIWVIFEIRKAPYGCGLTKQFLSSRGSRTGVACPTDRADVHFAFCLPVETQKNGCIPLGPGIMSYRQNCRAYFCNELLMRLCTVLS